MQSNLLVIRGEHKAENQDENQGEYLQRGIANRPFVRRFELAEHVQVVGAQLVDGLLTMMLKRELPEAMKPRRIEIALDDRVSKKVRQIEHQAAA